MVFLSELVAHPLDTVSLCGKMGYVNNSFDKPKGHTMTIDLTTTRTRSSALMAAALTFENLVQMIGGMVADSSARVYRDTFTRWHAWADQQGITPLDLTYPNVELYLADLAAGGQSKASRQRQLAALRKLAQVLAILDHANPARRAAYESLMLLKVRETDASKPQQRTRRRRALTPKEAEKMLHVWDDLPADGKTPAALAARNQAIVTTFLLTGLRRAELAALKWSDIDFENGVIHVAHGKGDKPRDVAVYGTAALDALNAWHICQPSGYQTVFVNFSKGGRMGTDKPMSTTALYNVVTETAIRAGIAHVTCHDLRRTLITELLATGAPIQDAQAQAGHASGSTTMRYAYAIDARKRRSAGRLRYG